MEVQVGYQISSCGHGRHQESRQMGLCFSYFFPYVQHVWDINGIIKFAIHGSGFLLSFFVLIATQVCLGATVSPKKMS